MSVHFSSGKDDWATPDHIYQPLNDEFHFSVDAAANKTNYKCPVWFGPGSLYPDALTLKEWGRPFAGNTVYLNPPYSRGLQARFIAKAAEQQRHGNTIVMLLPARTDTKAFHQFIWHPGVTNMPGSGVEVRFLKGRIKFVGAQHGAPFPSMVVVFRP